MKLKKTIILVCCVMIAALGITLTGCGNNSSDTVADSSSMIVESSTDVSAEGSADVRAESPDVSAESPDVSAESPDVSAESPDVSAESPDVSAESPDVSAENPYVGTWEGTIVESSEGEVVDVAEALGAYEITFHADNTFSGVIDQKASGEGTWELTENGLRMMESNGVTSDFIYQDGELLWVIEMLDVKATVHFVKKQ